MPSRSDTCSTSRRPLTCFSGTGNVSCRARDGSSVSQESTHTTSATTTDELGGGAEGTASATRKATRRFSTPTTPAFVGTLSWS